MILAIDTATPRVSVALGSSSTDDVPSVDVCELVLDTSPDRSLALSIRALCSNAGAKIANIDLIAVNIGPGLFTGLRVGMATAKALALARGLPVFAVTSLDAMAFPARGDSRRLVAAVDARRGEVFAATYGAGGVRTSDIMLLDPTGLGALVRDQAAAAGAGGVLVVGDGAIRYRDDLPRNGVELAGEELAHPRATAVLEMAVATAFPGPGGPHPCAVRSDARTLQPLYIRRAGATANWEVRGRARDTGAGLRDN